VNLAIHANSFANRLTRIPTSGGQYYWVAVLAPRPARRYLSYITGESFRLFYTGFLTTLM
jgi:hypothetical protein